MKPLLLDLCCKQGGASYGYVQAGFEVIGVDKEVQPRYPYEFVQMDALEYLATQDLSKFSAIHASPHCQGYTQLGTFHDLSDYPLDIPMFRMDLKKTGKIYIIENVIHAPIENGIILCGTMFGKSRLQRHRHFESNIYLYEPGGCLHKEKAVSIVGHMFNLKQARDLTDIEWMDASGYANCVPPFYTKFVGQQIMNFLDMNFLDKNIMT